ncbi:response regulator [Planctobacterium marinum]|uniref:response regulator n=1 Tax=Planctobacterium marinum TaxID=1631968 RepID=UPI001E4B4D96|nr:response regulator [Planctobacterium marinum]MCC2607084.1 response regulator [Planctobacterium marinum]
MEDNPVNRRIIGRQLQKLNYSFHLACDGNEGIEYWKKYNPKVILSDCHMPNLSGYEMTERIRKLENKLAHKQRTPILAITGAGMKEDQEVCLKAGMDEILLKPIQMEQLQQTLSKWFKYEK